MKFLIVDDSKVHLALLQVLLHSRGVEFVVTDNARTGLALARQHEPALIVSDVQMADMDGFAFCEALRRESALRKVPVVLVSGQVEAIQHERALAVGAAALLKKPVGKQIRQVVERVLGVPL